jgi:exopolysaccharide biosynthesis polyprenyl glycosylphosphotransferase
MNQLKRQILVNAFKLVDLGFMILSLGLATLLIVSERGTVSITKFLSMRIKVEDVLVFLALLLAWHLILTSFGLYESKRLATRRSEVIDVCEAVILSSIVLLLAAKLFSKGTATVSFLALFWILSFAFLVTVRFIARYMLGMLRRRGRNLRFMLMLGTNARSIEFAKRIESKPELGYQVLGFVDDSPAREEFWTSGYKVCCELANLSEYLRRNVVDEVSMYLPLRSFYKQAAQVAMQCEQHGIIMRFDSDIFNLKIAQSHMDAFDGDPQIIAHSSGFAGWPFLFKRTIDLVVSFVLVLLLVPLFLTVAVLVRLTSPGPVFFKQKRVGLNKRQFIMYKFRTMVPNAERIQEELLHLNEMSGPVFKIRNDPRMTPFGRMLRKTSIDELPQLFNVLKGDMSLVGPRPIPLRDYQFFNEDWQRRRFSVRPGITCLWQVGGRNSIPFERWMELDMEYIDQWSLWLDLKILVRTIPALLRGTGAV